MIGDGIEIGEADGDAVALLATTDDDLTVLLDSAALLETIGAAAPSMISCWAPGRYPHSAL